MSYDNNNSGVLFRNDKKTTDKHPDYKGNAEVGGVAFWVSGWIKQSKAGAKFMSLRFEPKEQQASKPVAELDNCDDIPFLRQRRSGSTENHTERIK